MSARIRATRAERGWSQQELADRAGVTRQLVGAVEAGRQVPSVAAALSIAEALGDTVEALFGPEPATDLVLVAGGAPEAGTPVVTAMVGTRTVAVPLAGGMDHQERWALPDAVAGADGARWLPGGTTDGIVVAGCDPLLGMMAALASRATPHRVHCAHATTTAAVTALDDGRVHGAVVHGPAGTLPRPPVAVRRVHVARWQVGLASASRRGRPVADLVEDLAESRLQIVQREPGASSQAALLRALGAVGAGEAPPGPVGTGHLDVARRVRDGSGVAGVTMEAAAQAFGLGFAPLEAHDVELWIDLRWSALPAVGALVEVLGSPAFRQRAALLAGYDLARTGASGPPA